MAKDRAVTSQHVHPGYAKTNHTEEVLTRLRKIEGQVRGLQRMVGEERYCVDVLAQISSTVNALERVGVLLLNDHIRTCVRDSLADGQGDDKVEELVTAVDRFLRAT
jgi:DNA-binding FrmR family transcriptional regulator